MPSPSANPLAWATAVKAQRFPAQLIPGQSLARGGTLMSPNYKYRFAFQADGNLVLYKSGTVAYWSNNIANQGGMKATFQADGNFVVYNAQNKPVWSTGTQGKGGKFFRLQDDGNLVMYNAANQPIWETRSWGGTVHDDKRSFLGNVAHTLGQGLKVAAIVGTGGVGAFVLTDQGKKLFKDVTQSPAWKVATGAAIFIPGIGPAVSAGMATAYAIGKAGSIKDAIIDVARSNLPGGDAAKAGFDIATGVAINGEGIDEAGLKFIRDQIPNGPAKAGFDAALSLHAGRVTSQAPAGLTPQGQVSFYATKGLLNADAPPDTKQAVASMTAHTPDGKHGLQTAIESHVAGGQDVSWLAWLWHQVQHLGVQVHASLLGPTPKNVITVHGESVS
jgi:hypothetical protein